MLKCNARVRVCAMSNKGGPLCVCMTIMKVRSEWNEGG
jgi:hypothetical protein